MDWRSVHGAMLRVSKYFARSERRWILLCEVSGGLGGGGEGGSGGADRGDGGRGWLALALALEFLFLL